MLQQDGAVDDGGRAGEGIGGAQGERAETHLGETAAEAFAAAARDGLVAQRAQQLDVVAIGIEHRVADHREAAGDGAEAGSDVDRRAGRPADGATEDGEAARVGAVTGGDAAGEDLERAARVQDETALEGVAAGERDGGADDVDAVLVGAADGGSVVQGVAAAAEAVDAGDARSEGARVGDVAHARAEGHARQVEAGLGEIDIGGRRERRHRDGARAGGVGEAIDLGERVDGVADDRAGAGDDEEAAGLVGIKGRRIERAARGDGHGTGVDGDRGLEGVNAAEGQDAEAVLDEATRGVRRIKGADGDRCAGATATREGDGRNSTGHIGAGAGDDDARNLAAADDGIAGSRGATGNKAGAAEGDERGADVAGAAGDGEVGLRHARAGGGGEAWEGDREAVRIDGQGPVRGGAKRTVVDRAEEGVRPDAVGRHDAIIRGQHRAAGIAEKRRQEALRHGRIGLDRAAREVVVTQVTAARVHADRGVVADEDRTGGDVEERRRSRDGSVTPAEIAAAEVERAARDVQGALRVRTGEDEADLADGILAVDETTLPHRELREALITEDEPVVAGVAIVDHARAADVAHADRGGVALVQVEARRAAAGRHLVGAAGEVEVAVADTGGVLITAVDRREESHRAARLVIDGDRADRLGATHRPDVDVAADVDGGLIRAGAEIDEGSGSRADVRAGEVQGTAGDGGIAGIAVDAGERQGARPDLDQAEGGDAAVADRAGEVGVGIVLADREVDRGGRVGILDETGTGEGTEDAAEAVEAEDRIRTALGGQDIGGIRAEGVRRAGEERQAGEGRATRVGIETGEADDRARQAREGEVIAGRAADGAGNRQAGAVGAGTGDGPGLGSAQDQRGADEDRAGVIVDRDTVRRAGGGDGQGRGELRTTLRDGHAGDAGRRRAELHAADGETAVERGDVGRGGRARGGAEDELVRDAREALGVRRARGVGREVGVVVGVVERGPAHVGADAPVEVGRERRRRQRDRGVRLGEAEGETTEGPEVADRERGAVEAAAGGEEVIRTGGEAGEARQVDDDLVGGGGRARRDDAVVGREGADIEAEGSGTRGAGAEIERAGTEVDPLADGVVEIEDRAGGDLDGGGLQGRGPAAGDAEAAAGDGGLADVGKDRARERQGADARLDEAEIVLVRTDATDGAVVDRTGVLVDRQVRDRGGTADDGVVADRAERAHDDGGAGAAAAAERDDGREARAIVAGVGEREAGDEAADDRGVGLGALRAHEAADGVEGHDRRRGVSRTRIDDGDVRGEHAGDARERGDGLIGGSAGVAELEDAAGGAAADEEVGRGRQAVIGAARDDELAVGDRGRTEEGVGRGEGQRTRAGLGEAAGAGACGAADRIGESEVVRADVEGAARGKQGHIARRDIVGETRPQQQRAAGEGEVARGAADVGERGDAERAFVDRRAPIGEGRVRLDAAAGEIRTGEHEGAAARLGDEAVAVERRRDRGDETRGDRGGPRVHHVEDVFVDGTAELDAAVEAAEGQSVDRAVGRERVEREDERAAADGEDAAGARAGDGDIAGRGISETGVEHDAVDGLAHADREVAGEHFADVVRRVDGRREGGIFGREVEGAEANTTDIRHQRVAHVGFGREFLLRGGAVFTDEPGRDHLVQGIRDRGLARGGLGGVDADLEAGGGGKLRDEGAGRDARTGDEHAEREAGGRSDVDDVAARGGRTGGQGDVAVAGRAPDKGGDEAQFAGRTGEPARGIDRIRIGTAERTATDVTRRKVGTGEARNAQGLLGITGDVSTEIARAGIEVESVDRLRDIGAAVGVKDVEAERTGVGIIRSRDDVGAGARGGVEVDVDDIVDLVLGRVEDAIQVEIAVSVDVDRGDVDRGRAEIQTLAGAVDAHRAGVDDEVAEGTAGIRDGQGGVADEAHVALAHELAVERAGDGLVDRERGAQAEVDEVVIGVGLAIAARDVAHGLAVRAGGGDGDGAHGVLEGRLGHQEALAFVDAQGAGGIGRDGREDETLGVERVDRDDDVPVEAGARTRDRDGLARLDAVIDGGGDGGDRRDGEVDGGAGRGVGVQREARAVRDARDVGVGRDARAGDRLADHEAGRISDGDRGGVEGGDGAGERDRRGGGETAAEVEGGDGRSIIDTRTAQEHADIEAEGAVDLDHGRSEGGRAGGRRDGDAVGTQAEDGEILIGERDGREVADGERTAAGPGEFDDAALELDEAGEVVGLGARAEREHAVAGLGEALGAVDLRGDEQALGRVARVIVAGDDGIPGGVVAVDDDLAGRRTERATLDDGDGAGLEVGQAGAGRRGGGGEREAGSGIDAGDGGPGRDARTGDEGADHETGGAGDVDGGRTEGRGTRGESSDRGRGGSGLQDATRDDLEEAAIRDGDDGRAGGVEAQRHRRDDVEQRAGVTGGIGDILTVEHARERIAGDRGHRDDVRTDAGGEVRAAGAVRDRQGGPEGADESGEEVVRGGGGDTVDRALRARGQGEADRARQTLGDRTEIQDEILATCGEEIDGRVGTGVTRGDARQGQSGDVLDDVQGGTSQQGDAAPTQLNDALRVNTIRDGVISRRGVV